jgi:hypothetical protein
MHLLDVFCHPQFPVGYAVVAVNILFQVFHDIQLLGFLADRRYFSSPSRVPRRRGFRRLACSSKLPSQNCAQMNQNDCVFKLRGGCEVGDMERVKNDKSLENGT